MRDDVGGHAELREHRGTRNGARAGPLGGGYISCVPDDPTTQYSNQATEAEKQADTVWWKSLGMPGELDSTGAFRAVHVHGDPFDGNNEPIIAPALAGFLGLYWGCQDIDPAAPPSSSTCDFYQEPAAHRSTARWRAARCGDGVGTSAASALA